MKVYNKLWKLFIIMFITTFSNNVWGQLQPEIKFFKDNNYTQEFDYDPLIGDTIYVEVKGIKGGHLGGANDAIKVVVYNSNSNIEKYKIHIILTETTTSNIFRGFFKIGSKSDDALDIIGAEVGDTIGVYLEGGIFYVDGVNTEWTNYYNYFQMVTDITDANQNPGWANANMKSVYVSDDGEYMYVRFEMSTNVDNNEDYLIRFGVYIDTNSSFTNGTSTSGPWWLWPPVYADWKFSGLFDTEGINPGYWGTGSEVSYWNGTTWVDKNIDPQCAEKDGKTVEMKVKFSDMYIGKDGTNSLLLSFYTYNSKTGAIDVDQDTILSGNRYPLYFKPSFRIRKEIKIDYPNISFPEIKIKQDDSYTIDLTNNLRIGDFIYFEITGLKGPNIGANNDKIIVKVINEDSNPSHNDITVTAYEYGENVFRGKALIGETSDGLIGRIGADVGSIIGIYIVTTNKIAIDGDISDWTNIYRDVYDTHDVNQNPGYSSGNVDRIIVGNDNSALFFLYDMNAIIDDSASSNLITFFAYIDTDGNVSGTYTNGAWWMSTPNYADYRVRIVFDTKKGSPGIFISRDIQQWNGATWVNTGNLATVAENDNKYLEIKIPLSYIGNPTNEIMKLSFAVSNNYGLGGFDVDRDTSLTEIRNPLYYRIYRKIMAKVQVEAMLDTITTSGGIINGSFIQLYPNQELWTQGEWNEEIGYMENIGMKFVLIQYSVTSPSPTGGATYYSNSVRRILTAASNYNMKVIVGLREFDDYNGTVAQSQIYYNQMYYAQTNVINWLNSKFGNNPAFWGYYIPQEVANNNTWTVESNMRKIKTYWSNVSKFAKTKSPTKIVSIAPYFAIESSYMVSDRWRDWWLDVLKNNQLDLIMMQDGYGCLRNLTFTHIKDYFTKVKEACLISGKKLWDDIEIFKQIPPETPFNAIPGNMITISSQIDTTSTIVSTNVSFEFPFYMSPRDFSLG